MVKLPSDTPISAEPGSLSSRCLARCIRSINAVVCGLSDYFLIRCSNRFALTCSMRGKKHNVCHTCRRHKIGCDGMKPACSQCRLLGRECGGYFQELVVFHHQPTHNRPCAKKKKSTLLQCPTIPQPKSNAAGQPLDHPVLSDLHKYTYDQCVAILVQHYIPKDEIPFLSLVEPSKSRICGGWVQALAHVSQSHADFKSIVSPAVRALTISLMVTSTSHRQEYLDTYGDAIQGIRTVLYRANGPVGSTVSIAGMCLALSEILVPTSKDGYETHLRGVAAMMQNRGPSVFAEGVAHLMFVGVRPLLVLDAILRRKTTFLMEEQWQVMPFSVHHASRMQILLGHATAIPPLLEASENEKTDLCSVQTGFLEVLGNLQSWEDSFLGEGASYQLITPDQLDITIDPKLLPNPCLEFVDVSYANCLTHCWAFRVVCLLHILKLKFRLLGNENIPSNCTMERDWRTSIWSLCTLICQGLPYLLQKEMSLYGSMSAAFPLHVVSESLYTLQLQDCSLRSWYTVIREMAQHSRNHPVQNDD